MSIHSIEIPVASGTKTMNRPICIIRLFPVGSSDRGGIATRQRRSSRTNYMDLVTLSIELFDQAAKISNQVFYFLRSILDAGDLDRVGDFDLIDLPVDDAVPESVKITSMPSGSADSFKKSIVKIVPSSPANSI